MKNDPTLITREEALKKLQLLIGRDLRPYAKKYQVNIFRNGKLNKGWAGETIERYLGLNKNNNQRPNGEYFELKQISLKRLKNGAIVPKETMQITMINPRQNLERDFYQSHVYKKMKSIIICAIMYGGPGRETKLFRVDAFDLDHHQTIKQLKEDYEKIKDALNNKGFSALKSEMGVYIQPRTKGAGHGSTSRAFYARTKFLKIVLEL